MASDQAKSSKGGDNAASKLAMRGLLPRTQDAVMSRLVKGEEVLGVARIHRGIYWRAVAVFILSILFAVFFAHELGLLLLGVAVLMGLYAKILRRVLLLVITNKRVLTRYGILQVDVVDIHFDKVESIELEQMPPGMIMGYSNVVVMGTGNRYIVIPYVANGAEIRQKFTEITIGD
jgi:hypothetical protein